MTNRRDHHKADRDIVHVTEGFNSSSLNSSLKRFSPCRNIRQKYCQTHGVPELDTAGASYRPGLSGVHPKKHVSWFCTIG